MGDEWSPDQFLIRSFIPSLIQSHDHRDRADVLVFLKRNVVIIGNGRHIQSIQKFCLDPVSALSDRVIYALIECITLCGTHLKIRKIGGVFAVIVFPKYSGITKCHSFTSLII